MSANRYKILALSAAMLLILLLFTLPLWSADRLLFQGDVINSDVTELNFPARYLESRALEGEGLPFWNSYIGCGFPQLAEGQSGLLYPLNLALFLTLDPTLAFNLSVILSLLLALVFSYLLFRHYGLSHPASLFSATAFTFSGFVIAKLKFTYMVNSICWIPLAVYGLEKAFSGKNLSYLFLTTIALAMQVLAGGPQIFLITLYTLGVIFAWRFFSLLFKKAEPGPLMTRRNAAYLLLGIALCVALALALAAPQLMPQLKGYPSMKLSRSQTFEGSLVKPMQARNLVQFVSPYQYGNPARGTYNLEYDLFWENIAYPGLLTLILALIAILFAARRDRTVMMWTLVGFLALAVSLGDNLPVAEFLWKYAPGFSLFRFWQRFLVIVVLALALLAGKGLDYLLSFFKNGRTGYCLVIILVFVVLLADLGLFACNQVSTIDSDRMLEENRVAQWLKANLGEEGENYRIAVLGWGDVWKEALRQSNGWLGEKDLFLDFMELLPPNHNSLFGIYGVTQYGDYGIYRFKLLDTLTNYVYLRRGDWEAEFDRSSLNILAMEGVHYLISPFKLEMEGLEEVESMPTAMRGVDIHIYELTGSFPRAYIAQSYIVLDLEEYVPTPVIIETMHDYDVAREWVILEKQPAMQYTPGSGGEACITHMDNRKVTVEARSPAGGILVLSDSYYPEWRVFVDGREREMLRVNYDFRGVELEPGEHVVEFVFKPSSLYYGILICVAGLLLLLLLLLYNRSTGLLRLYGASPDEREEGRGETPSEFTLEP